MEIALEKCDIQEDVRCVEYDIYLRGVKSRLSARYTDSAEVITEFVKHLPPKRVLGIQTLCSAHQISHIAVASSKTSVVLFSVSGGELPKPLKKLLKSCTVFGFNMEEQTMNLHQQLNIHIMYPHDTEKFWMENSPVEWNPQKFALDCAIAAPVLLPNENHDTVEIISHLCLMAFFSLYVGKKLSKN